MDHPVGTTVHAPFDTAVGAATANALEANESKALLCFSHLRWHFVFQRPQHLMTRFAKSMRVFFHEEPVFGDVAHPVLERHETGAGVTIIVPRLPHGLDEQRQQVAMRKLLDELVADEEITEPVLWYYTPMMRPFSAHLQAKKIVYDCMDELTAFRGAPPALVEREQELLRDADVVFTGGYSLYEAKRGLHPNVHAFPSSVDVAHFAKARLELADPPDQRPIPRPRIGHYAVLDERLDIDLLAGLAEARPDWQFILVGPIVKIDPASLPRRPNVHYLGGKKYDELPAYLAGWDVAFMPFAMNESTRFISPTKTPEYLAAGKPVVSTPITDVVRTYGGDVDLARIARTVPEFVAAIEAALHGEESRADWLRRTDRLLGEMSWDRTWSRMRDHLK
jgi:glycosyltransferase involved in cell wall biosynthesis